jgi:hypothetical protein
MKIFAILLIATPAFSQVDSLYRHDGKASAVVVLEITNSSIVYNIPGDSIKRNIGKLAVSLIRFSSGRVQEISSYVRILGEQDYEKVVVINSEEETVGLKEIKKVMGKTAGFLSAHSARSSQIASLRRIKKEAARANAPFVFINYENLSEAGSYQSSSYQSTKKGIAYGYR